jgi:hypothetical protein
MQTPPTARKGDPRMDQRETMKNSTLRPDPEKMNAHRANRAHAMIQEFWRSTDDVPEQPFANILCDFMHWADHNGVHFDDNLARARVYYALETSRCIEIFVEALNTIAAGNTSRARMVEIAADALQSAPNARSKIDPGEIPF